MVALTVLNAMAGQDFLASLDQHVAWGISHLDLKDGIWGKTLLELSVEEARRATEAISERGLTVYCFSTGLFHPEVERGEAEFRRTEMAQLDHLIALARVMRPQIIRLLAAQTVHRLEVEDTIQYLQTQHPWVVPLYGEAVDRLADAGLRVTIENETGRCIFGHPREIVDFFAALGRRDRVSFTWDAQNLWEVGSFPTLEVYRQLQALIGYLHLKGGQHDGTRLALCWRTALEDASWPVLEITRQAVADGVSPVICLNPSHGAAKPGYDYTGITERDLTFLRRMIPELSR